MARKTKADLEQEIADLTRWHDEQAERIRELLIDLDNAKNEIASLREQLTEQLTERAETKPARPEGVILPDKPRRGRKPKADPETRAEIHELRKAVDGDGKPYNSLSQIAIMTEMSKTQVHAILKEPEPVGRWYSTDTNGKRKYYKDYRTATRSGKDIHFEAKKEGGNNGL